MSFDIFYVVWGVSILLWPYENFEKVIGSDGGACIIPLRAFVFANLNAWFTGEGVGWVAAD